MLNEGEVSPCHRFGADFEVRSLVCMQAKVFSTYCIA